MNLEKQIIRFANIARQHPSYFISAIQKQKESFISDNQIHLNEEIIYETIEGKKAWQQAQNFLKNQKFLHPLQQHEGLNMAAKDHVQDLTTNRIIGHIGTDGSTFSKRIIKYCHKGHGSMAELIGADFNIQNRNHAQMTILGLIIDDGVLDRGHRNTIFNPSYQFIGCKSQIQGQKIITVLNLTEKNLVVRTQYQKLQQPRNSIDNTFEQQNSLPLKQIKNSELIQPKFCNTDFPFKKQSKKLKNQKLDLTNITTRCDSVKRNSTPQNFKEKSNNKSKNPSISQCRKLCQKKESSKTYYQKKAKVTQITTKLIYNDGTFQEKIEKHTVYLQK